MSVRDTVSAITLTSIDSATFVNTFQTLNASLTGACIILRVINNSNTDIIVSYDGIHDQDFVPKNTILQLDFQTNSQPNNKRCTMPIGTHVWVRGVMGAGLVYCAGYYQTPGV